MPRLITYPHVLTHARDRGMRCLYHNAGAFAFDPAEPTHVIGWIGPPDSTIRPDARKFTRNIPPPYAEHFTTLTLAAWQQIGGPAWLLPMSHWAFELEFGNPLWLRTALAKIGIDPVPLSKSNQASAIEFSPTEPDSFTPLLAELFANLAGSDFSLMFPAAPLFATLHHHRQVWWTSTDEPLISELSALPLLSLHPPD